MVGTVPRQGRAVNGRGAEPRSPGVFIIAQTMRVRIAIEELLLLCLALWESRGLTAYGHRGPACAAGLCCDRFYAARLAMGLLVQKLRE